MEKTELIQGWLLAKSQEDKAKKARLEIEKQLISEFGDKSQTIKEVGFKLTISAGTSIKVVDCETIEKMVSIYGNKLPIKVKYDIVKKELDYLEKVNPSLHQEILGCCEEKPKKPSVKIEVHK